MNTKFLSIAYFLVALGATFAGLLFNEVIFLFQENLSVFLFDAIYGGGIFAIIFLTYHLGEMIVRDYFCLPRFLILKLLSGIVLAAVLFLVTAALYQEYSADISRGYRMFVESFAYVYLFVGLFFFIELGRVNVHKLLKHSLGLLLFLFAVLFAVSFIFRYLPANYFVPSAIFVSTMITLLSVYFVRYALRRSWLLILNGQKAGMDYPLRSSIVLIGNQDEDDLRLNDYPEVNPAHAKIIRYGNSELFSLVDNDPFCRTWLNFRETRDQMLQNRDIITIGTAKIMFCTENS